MVQLSSSREDIPTYQISSFKLMGYHRIVFRRFESNDVKHRIRIPMLAISQAQHMGDMLA